MEQELNPYASTGTATNPPAAAVSPVRLVRIAVGLYVASFLMMLPAMVMSVLVADPEIDEKIQRVVAITTVVTAVLVGLVTAFISYRLLRRSRGARLWLIGFTLVWIVFLVMTGAFWEGFHWEVAVDTAGTLVRIAAGAMMLLPGVRAWFVDAGDGHPELPRAVGE